MDPLVKRLLVIGVVGLIVAWGTFLALELAPESEDPDPVESETVVEPRANANVAASKKLEQKRSSRIAIAKRRRAAKKVPVVRPPVVNRPEPPVVPQQTAAIKAPLVPDLPPKLPTAANPAQARFKEMEKVYESESRDTVWADEKEKRILDVFKKGEYSETLVDISCHKTLCRMEIRMDSPETLFRLFKIPGLAEEIGLNAASQPLGEGDDKRMISFITRKEAVK